MRQWMAGVCLCAFCLCGTVAGAQQQDDAAQANALWNAGKHIEALPFYEKLAKEHPEQWLYQERFGVALENKADQETDPAKIRDLLTRAKAAAQKAVEDKTPDLFVQNMANMDVDAAVASHAAIQPGTPRAIFQEGEKLFSKGDYAAAMEKYAAAAAADPKMYEAPLYAGDAAYSNKDLKTAGLWFAKAIAIDPNRETAYRYWGDAILKFGSDPYASKTKEIDAIVAEPYNRLSWQGIVNWARIEKAILASPKIQRPAGPTVDAKNPNNINITIDPAATDDKKNPGASAWMMYSIVRASYHGDLFKKDFPDEKQYRHTLKEESTALHAVAEGIANQKIPPDKLDESLRNIVELDKAGMLDCWILINGADQGIAQDYPAYRKEHWKLLHDYIDRFVVHGGGNPSEPQTQPTAGPTGNLQ
jgi:tetratricopeptide (TPR) repeat protein